MIQIYHLYVGIRKILTNSDATVIPLNIDKIELIPLSHPLFVPVVSAIFMFVGKRIAKIYQDLTPTFQIGSETAFSAPSIHHPTQTRPELETYAAHSC